MGNFNPKLPTKHVGTNKYITFFVSRNRSPTGADYRQPETGTLYSVGTVWQVSKDPATGTEGDLWMLSKIVANVGYWIQISSGVTPSGAVLSLSDTAGTLVYPTVAGNIQIEGTAGQIDVISVPGSNKLTLSLPGGGGAVDSFTVQAVTAPGVNPVTPTGAGIVTVNGAVVANHSVPLETRSRALNTYNLEVQYATTAAATDGTKSGVAHFDSARFTADATGFISLNGAGVGETITGQSGGALSPTAGNWNIYGLGEMTTSGSGSTLSILQPKAAKIIVDPTLNYGNYQTLTAAMAAATSGTTILVRPGTYTEATITLKSGVNIVALNAYNQSGQVLINTKFIDNGSAISCTFSGVTFSTPTDYSFVLTGNSVVAFNNCYCRGTDHTIISITTSATMRFFQCLLDLETTGIAPYDMTGGALFFERCNLANSGSSTTVGTHSDGSVVFHHCINECKFQTTGTGIWNWYNCRIDTSFFNGLALTSGGNQTHEIMNTSIASGSAACVSVGAGTIVIACNMAVKSSTAFVLTGAGTLKYGSIVFYGSSNGHNVSTETALTVL